MKALAIDLGGSHATCALVEDRRILATSRLATDGLKELGSLLPRIGATLGDLLERCAVPAGECSGLALGFCGIVDPIRSVVLSTNGKYDDAPSLDLARWSQATLGLPLRMENDARMALLGEHSAGAAQGFDDVVMITLGTGVGGAAMINGRLLHGKHFQAGCLGGHLPVDYRGGKCTCGSIGCVEAEASGWALPAICRAQPGFDASALASEPAITFEAVFRHAAGGDVCASEVRTRCLQVWAAGAVGLVHAYDPELIVLGGGVMNAAGQILPFVQDYVCRHSWTPWGTVQVRCAALGNEAALLGAIPLIAERFE